MKIRNEPVAVVAALSAFGSAVLASRALYGTGRAGGGAA